MSKPETLRRGAGSPEGNDAHAAREAVIQPVEAAEHLNRASIIDELWFWHDAACVLRQALQKRAGRPTARLVIH